MMNKKAEVTPNRLRQEHSEIVELERQLLKDLCERTQTPARIAELFHALYDRTTAHLRDEESGVIHDACAADPSLARQCDKLSERHERLKSKMEHLLKIIDQGACSTEWWATLEKRFHEFVVELNGHESSEQRLVDEIEKIDVPEQLP